MWIRVAREMHMLKDRLINYKKTIYFSNFYNVPFGCFHELENASNLIIRKLFWWKRPNSNKYFESDKSLCLQNVNCIFFSSLVYEVHTEYLVEYTNI